MTIHSAHVFTVRILHSMLQHLAEHAKANQAQNQRDNSTNHAQRTGDNTIIAMFLPEVVPFFILHQGNNTQNHANQTQHATEKSAS